MSKKGGKFPIPQFLQKGYRLQRKQERTISRALRRYPDQEERERAKKDLIRQYGSPQDVRKQYEDTRRERKTQSWRERIAPGFQRIQERAAAGKVSHKPKQKSYTFFNDAEIRRLG